jgi:hypothetical protein
MIYLATQNTPALPTSLVKPRRNRDQPRIACLVIASPKTGPASYA